MTLDLNQLIADIRDIAGENPDKRYRERGDMQCHYNRDAYGIGVEHGCLIGQAVARQFPFDGEWEGSTGTVRALLLDYFGFSDESLNEFRVNWVARVQVLQDRGRTWGSCVQQADLETFVESAPADLTS